MQISADWERAQFVFGNLVRSLQAAEYPYNDSILPQRFIGSEISKDPVVHAQFLFYICHYMRGSVKSDFAIKELAKLWKEWPEFFDPHAVARLDIREIHVELQTRLKYRPTQISEFWKENSRRLVLHWEGDPRKIFEGVTTPDGMYERITNKAVRQRGTDPNHRFAGFPGFQKKMASMLHYFLADARLIAPLTASPPIDFHNLRIMIATGVLVVEKGDEEALRYEHLTPLGIAVTERYCREYGVSSVELGDAMWALSVALCSKAPGNLTVGRNKGETDKRILPTLAVVSWKNKRHLDMHTRSCGVCPAAAMCTRNVPSGTYYYAGRFDIRDRSIPPLLSVFPLFGGKLPQQVKPAIPRMSIPPLVQKPISQPDLFPFTKTR